MARVSKWSEAERREAVELVLDGMAEGKTLADTVRDIARQQRKAGKIGDAVLTQGQVRRWVVEDETQFVQYQRMKRLLGQAFAEEALHIARESTTSSTALDRVLIDTLKWAAAKANPSEYGEKQTVEHQGAQTLQVKIVEDDAPIRNPKAAKQIGNAIATAMTTPVILSLPAVQPIALNPSEDTDE
jgi:hypothetical protein